MLKNWLIREFLLQCFQFFQTLMWHRPTSKFGFMEQVSKAAISSRKDAVIFLSIGKNQGVGAKIWNSMQSLPNHIIRFLRLGELPENEISQFLHSADFGVATTQLSLLGKSGTAAAYARHGLPTIIPRIDISDDKKMQDFKGITFTIYPVHAKV